jgi:TM2 domain-containing membrane protein YozV
MKKLIIKYCLLSLSLLTVNFAQISELENYKLTGNLLADSKIVLNDYEELSAVFALDDLPDKKSPVLAGVMSAIIPGSGEIYVGEYLKAAIFLAIEATLITVAVVNNNEGDKLTSEFEAFADEHWSVVDYADYLIDNREALGLPEDCEIPINRDSNLPPWEQILDWEALNHCESPFSHHLPHYGQQQYYELIGKYPQYSSGWDEFDPAVDGFREVPQIMKDYSIMRGNANDAYNVASKAVIGLYINHLLSAIDAVWSATTYNKNLAINMRVQNMQLANRIEFVPTLNISYNF